MRDLEEKLQSAKDHLVQSLSAIRTGTANVSLIENILVEAYEGSPSLTLKELATLRRVDSRTLLVEPWDKGITEKIAQAIRRFGSGLNPVVDGDVIKIPIPPLTEEGRREFVKLVGKRVEEAKIAVRNIRKDAMRSLDEQKENSIISEDDYFRQRAQVEDSVKEITKEIEEIGKKKKEELLGV